MNASLNRGWTKRLRRARNGAALVLLALGLPMIIAILGLVLDGGLMMDEGRNLQHATDAAATAAAMDLRLGKSASVAVATANEFIQNSNDFPDANVTVHIPPIAGPFSGQAGYVDVVAESTYRPRIMPIFDGLRTRTLHSHAIAGAATVTAGGAVVVLDPHPDELSITPLPNLPALPTITAGFEIEGLGNFSVDGAVLVNTEWGGVDENGAPAGDRSAPPYGVACMPVLPITRLRARDIRVAGGVDAPSNYENFQTGQRSPLQANRLPVPDPFAGLPVPTTSTDPSNVNPLLRGGVTVAGAPLIGPPVTLQPGVYEYIRVVSGIVTFTPGVYIIRNVEPDTQMSLQLIAGTVNAQGVLFYITNAAGYDGVSGGPDASDVETPPASGGASQLTPSVFIQASLLGSGISGLNDPDSPFDGMVIYQRRHDRRPIVIAHQNLLGGDFAGTVYAKWGHVAFVGNGTYDARFVCGSMRVLTLFDSMLAPSKLLPPAQDVLLVE
jgi:Flp pilus assembly protein TadG